MATIIFGSGFRAPREEAPPPPPPAKTVVTSWVLIAYNIDSQGGTLLLWSPDRERLEAWARARRYKDFQILWATEAGEPPTESPREISASLLDVPTTYERTAFQPGRNFVRELRLAGYLTLGDVADAGVDGLRRLGFPRTVIRQAEASLRGFGLELAPEAADEAA